MMGPTWTRVDRSREREITYKTVVEGRPTKGMPTWGDTLSPRAIQEIVAFLESVQN